MSQAPAIALTRTKRPENEPVQRPLDLGLIRRMMGYMRAHVRTRNWLLLCVLIRSVQLPCLAWAIGQVINGPVARRDLAGITWGAMGFFALAAFTQLVFHFRIRLALNLGAAVVHDLRNELFAHLQRMPMAFFDQTKLGRIISRVTSDSASVRTGVQDVLFVTLVGGGQMVVTAMFMAWCDPVLFLIVVAMAPVLWGINTHFRRKLSYAHRASRESYSRITATLAESVNGVRVTQGFVRQDVNAELFGDLAASHAQNNLRADRTSGLFLPLVDFNSQFFIAALLLVGGYRVLSPVAMPVGDLIQFFLLTNYFFQPIQILGNMYNQSLEAMAGAERVFALLDRPPEWEDEPDAQPIGTLAGRIEFESVTFGYNPDRPVLHDVSFVVEPGKLIALVGATGSGKTTITNLITRFYLPQAGRVLVDDHDVRKVQGASLHRQMGIVLQQNFLFSGTVLENIRFARPEATDEEVITAAERLDCRDLIETLPDGFQTELGERGVNLSLGQRQLICFCRAMLADPRILILDEATSSIDTITEHRVQQALNKLLAGRTSIVVAHRLSTIRHADQVLVLEDGRIVERGRHAELVAAGGPYARLHEQFVQTH